MHPRSSHGRVRVRIGDNLYKRFTDGGEPRYEVKFRDTDGSLRSVTLKGASTDAGARKAAREVLRARDSGTRQVGKPVTVDETFAAWRADLDAKVGAGQRSARGVEVYVGRYMRHIRPAFGPIRLDKVTKADLLDLVATLRRKRLSEATCLGVLGTVRSLYSFAQRRDLVSRNPVADIHPDDRPRPTKTARPILDEAQVDVLVAHSPELYRAAVATLAWTGMRVSEVVALQWQHVDFVEREIRVEGQLTRDGKAVVPPKTDNSIRSVPLLPALERALTEHLRLEVAAGRGQEADWVFSTAVSTPQSQRNVADRGVRIAARRAGLPIVGPHDLRRSFCSISARRNVDPVIAARITGHTTATWMNVYARDFGRAHREEAKAKLVAAGFGC